MNKNTGNNLNLDETCKTNRAIAEMMKKYKKETNRLKKENAMLKKKEEDEFTQLVYETGIPVCYDNKITILDKKTNKIIDISDKNI
jgi:hypothetical protein